MLPVLMLLSLHFSFSCFPLKFQTSGDLKAHQAECEQLKKQVKELTENLNSTQQKCDQLQEDLNDKVYLLVHQIISHVFVNKIRLSDIEKLYSN